MQAETEIETLLHYTPHQYGIARTRWRLCDIAQCISWLHTAAAGTVCALLKQLGFSHKQPERFQRSPDPAYEEKVAALASARSRAQRDPYHIRLYYLDELTYYRHASLKPLYQRTGAAVHHLVERPGANTKTRIGAALDALDGSLISLQRSHVGVRELKLLLEQLAHAAHAQWPECEELIVVLDNWPVHHHDAVTAKAADLGITLLYLPSYASWLNPIERLWRWLRHDITHAHPFGVNLAELRTHTLAWLAARQAPSSLTLFRTGLLSAANFQMTILPNSNMSV